MEIYIYKRYTVHIYYIHIVDKRYTYTYICIGVVHRKWHVYTYTHDVSRVFEDGWCSCFFTLPAFLDTLNWNNRLPYLQILKENGTRNSPGWTLQCVPMLSQVVSTHAWASSNWNVQRIQIIILKLRHGSTRNGPVLGLGVTIPGLDLRHLFGLSCEPETLMRKPERGINSTPLLTRLRSWLKDATDFCKSKSQLWGQLQKTT